jgi:hypothetical protein
MSDEDILMYLDKFAEYNKFKDCFTSEECASNWMQDYNFLSEKINEKSALLEVYFNLIFSCLYFEFMISIILTSTHLIQTLPMKIRRM